MRKIMSEEDAKREDERIINAASNDPRYKITNHLILRFSNIIERGAV